MAKPQLHYDLLKQLAGKVMIYWRKSPMIRPPFNFMFTSNRCKNAILGQFGKRSRVSIDVSPWFTAYLIQYGLLRARRIDVEFGAPLKIYGKELVNVDELGAVDVLSYMLGLEDSEPGISLCQQVDLRLDHVRADISGDCISDFDWFLALGSTTCVFHLYSPIPRSLSGGSRARFPKTTEIFIRDLCGTKPKPCEWIRFLSYLIDVCPSLTKLDVLFELEKEDLSSASLDTMANFREYVFASLPQKTRAVVRIMFSLTVWRREQIEDMRRDHEEAIRRNFIEVAPEDMYIPDVGYPRGETILHRAIQWERGEGMDSWWALLQIISYF